MKMRRETLEGKEGLVMLNGVKREFRTDDGSVWLMEGDCLEILPQLSGIDACVTDPPYGIGWDVGINPYGNLRSQFGKQYKPIVGDDKEFDPTPFLAFDKVVLFGANHFANKLPNSGAWIVWDKRMHVASTDQSDCEMAWFNVGNCARMIRYLYHGGGSIAKENGTAAGQGKVVSLHPTQKPVEVMLRCLDFIGIADTILDPFTGSGTTGLACIRTGRKFIGIEIDPHHYDTAVSRIQAELARTALLEPVPKITQRSLLEDA